MANRQNPADSHNEPTTSGPLAKRAARLTRQRVVAETLALIDEQGIAAVSMREVGERLGVQGMALYRHVASRDELFDLVVERVVDELSADPDVRTRPVDGWRDYLVRLAHGVRRYAIAHPHAFPLVATRPATAPWLNPPLRSLRWVETLLAGLQSEGFDDDQTLYTYRTFNTFLLGFLLLETSAMALRDPKPGDGSFQQTDADTADDAIADPAHPARTVAPDAADPVPGALSATRTAAEHNAIDAAGTPRERLDPTGGSVDDEDLPTIARLRTGLTFDYYAVEFDHALADLLNRIDEVLDRRRP